MSARTLILAAVIIAAVPAPSRAQDDRGGLTGAVTDRVSGEPLADVTVVATHVCSTDACASIVAVTGPRGRYQLDGLAPGMYTLLFIDGEESTERRSIPVAAGETRTVNVLLGAEMGTLSGDFCVGDSECPGWQVCSVGLGDCDGAMAPFEVCTGVCRDGWLHLAARVEGTVIVDTGAGMTAALSLEAIPPKLGGRVSVAADWWTDGALRLGAAFWLRPHDAFALSARVDGVRADGAWHPAAAARLEWSPIWPFSRIGPWGQASVLAEAGVILDDERTPVFGALAIGGWLRLP